MYRAYDRMALETARIPMAVSNIAAAGGELHIIGRDQVTTDLPEWRQDKHVPLYEPTYNGTTRDRRTRGMGGLITSCGEENLLNLPRPTIAIAAAISACTNSPTTSKATAWAGKSAPSSTPRPKSQKTKGFGFVLTPAPTRRILRRIDHVVFQLARQLRRFARNPAGHPAPRASRSTTRTPLRFLTSFTAAKWTFLNWNPATHAVRNALGAVGSNRTPAGRVVGRLNSYKIGETKLSQLYADAGVAALGDAGQERLGRRLAQFNPNG